MRLAASVAVLLAALATPGLADTWITGGFACFKKEHMKELVSTLKSRDGMAAVYLVTSGHCVQLNRNRATVLERDGKIVRLRVYGPTAGGVEMWTTSSIVVEE